MKLLRERFLMRLRSASRPAHRSELGPCLEWTGGRDREGYGRVYVGRDETGQKYESAHRLAFFFEHGRWPTPCALHHCDNPACVKVAADEHGPAHVYEGDQMQNNRDMRMRGRAAPFPIAEHTVRGEAHARAKIDEATVRVIRQSREGPRALGRLLGLSHCQIIKIRQRKSWSHVT